MLSFPRRKSNRVSFYFFPLHDGAHATFAPMLEILQTVQTVQKVQSRANPRKTVQTTIGFFVGISPYTMFCVCIYAPLLAFAAHVSDVGNRICGNFRGVLDSIT